MDSRRQQTRWFNATSNIIKKHRLTLLVLSAAVVFVATYLLILPAMTLDEDDIVSGRLADDCAAARRNRHFLGSHIRVRVGYPFLGDAFR